MSVLVQLFEEMLVFFLGGGGVLLVFHFKHYGYYLHTVFITFTVDKVALAS